MSRSRDEVPHYIKPDKFQGQNPEWVETLSKPFDYIERAINEFQDSEHALLNLSGFILYILYYGLIFSATCVSLAYVLWLLAASFNYVDLSIKWILTSGMGCAFILLTKVVDDSYLSLGPD